MISMTGAGRSPWSMFDELASLQEDLNRAFFTAGGTRLGLSGAHVHPFGIVSFLIAAHHCTSDMFG